MIFHRFFAAWPGRGAPGDARTAPGPAERRLLSAAFLVVLGVAFLLRFYQLGTPTFWYDEMWTALVAKHDLRFIIDYALRFDQHPPLQNIVFKLVGLMGRDDFAARSLYAACGVGAVFVVHRTASAFVSPVAALFSAAFLATCYPHVWMSRTVRVYSLVIFCYAVALHLLLRYAARRDRSTYGLLACACLVLAGLHHVGILLDFQVYLTLCALTLSGDKPGRRKLAACAGHSALYLALVLPSLYFLGNELANNATGAHFGHRSVADLLSNLAFTLDRFSLVVQGWSTLWAVYVPALAGAVVLVAGRGPVGRVLLGFWCVPLAIIFCGGYSNGIGFTYVGFLLVPLALFFGCGAAALAGLCRLPAGVCALAVMAALPLAAPGVLTANAAHLYTQDNLETKFYFPVGLYKQMAKTLLREPDLGLVAFGDAFLGGGVNWYVDQFAQTNFLKEQTLEPPSPRARLALVYLHEDAELTAFMNALRATAATFEQGASPYYKLVKATFDRQRLVFDDPSQVFSLDSRPENSLRQASRISRLTVSLRDDATLAATSPEGGFIDYTFENARQATRYSVYCALSYRNAALSGRVALSYALDGGEFSTVFTSAGPDRANIVFASIPVDRPFSRLVLRVALRPDESTARSGIENNGLVTLRSLKVSLSEREHADQGLTALYAQTLPQGRAATALFGQQVLARAGLATLADQSPETTVAHAGQTGELRVGVGDVSRGFFLYPRLFGESDAIFVTVPDGDAERQLLGFRGNGKTWTPMGMQVPLDLPEKTREVRIRLYGKAQLLTKDGKPLFED